MIVIAAQPGIGFPGVRGAAAARVACYARGLHAAGRDVTVLCLGTSEPSPPEEAFNTAVRGVSDGIPFEYTCGTTIRSTGLWRRRWLRIRGLVGAALRIRRLARRTRVEAVLLYSDSLLDAAVMRFAARSVGAVHVVDLCELPHHARSGIVLRRVRMRIHNRIFFRWFDGVIAISDYLRRHALAHGPTGLTVTRAPAMVDMDEFRVERPSTGLAPVVMYCGTLNQAKDGVMSLMRAFASVAPDMTDVQLSLVGDALEGSRIPEYRAVAQRLGVADRVKFAGNVEHSEIPALLSQATVLVLARPRTPQADAGMPTKVAEYLASGAPAIVTRTGEIAVVLKDGLNAYLIPPNDESALEGALRRVLSHPEEARAVGQRGREFAADNLDYRIVGGHVADFIQGLGDAVAGSWSV